MAMLTKAQRTRFEELKSEIGRNILRNAEALIEINRDRLYLDDYDTFEEFVRKEYGMSAKNAYNVMRYKGIASRLTNTIETPKTHRVFQVLNRVEEDRQRDVWCAALDRFDGKPSDKQLQLVAVEMGAIKAAGRNSEEREPKEPSDIGYFYVIQTIPDVDTARIKMGFTGTIEDRMSAFRQACPTSKLLKYWPCKKAWERTVMDSISSASHCKHIAGEVYSCSNLDVAIRHGNELFRLLPAV